MLHSSVFHHSPFYMCLLVFSILCNSMCLTVSPILISCLTIYLLSISKRSSILRLHLLTIDGLCHPSKCCIQSSLFCVFTTLTLPKHPIIRLCYSYPFKTFFCFALTRPMSVVSLECIPTPFHLPKHFENRKQLWQDRLIFCSFILPHRKPSLKPHPLSSFNNRDEYHLKEIFLIC